MSRFDYTQSKIIVNQDPTFAALIMAAVRRADSMNALKLRAAFPNIVAELEERYNRPGGLLESEQ